jgi:Ca-activated chloride channel family protein
MGRLVFLLIAALATAQQPSFKSTVELVTVPIAVTNVTRDKLISGGLTAADFRIYEDGVEQKVSLFTQDRRATSLCIVVDASGSMVKARRHDLGVAALQHTVRGLERGDEVAIVRFADKITTVMPWTRNPDERKVTWRLEPAAGSMANSSITDAARAALDVIDKASNPRRAILIISDGYENTSNTSLSRVVRTRAQSEALVYAFGLDGPYEYSPLGLPLANILPALVGDSGGVYLNIASMSDAAAAGLTLLNEFKYQYTLAYTPIKPLDGTYRRLKVEIAVPELLVRHRGGYLALPSSGERP